MSGHATVAPGSDAGKPEWLDTPQTLDPLGGLTARHFASASTAIAGGVVALMLVTFSASIQSPLFQTVALAAFVVAAVSNLQGVDPGRFPYGPVRHAVLHALMLVAFAFDCASRPPGVTGSWAPVALTILVVVMGSFRPWIEILVFTGISAITIAIIAWLGGATPGHVLAYIVPLVSVGAGAAAFSRVLVTRVREWQRFNEHVVDTERASIRASEEAEAIARRTELVDYRVGPFLEQILASGQVTPVDIARARGLATTLRTMLLRSARASWLAELVDELDDPDRLLDTLTADQRRVIGAGLAEARYSAPIVLGTVHAVLTAGHPRSMRITAQLRPGEGAPQGRAAAYRAVLRYAFPVARIELREELLELYVEMDEQPRRA
ncbi:hypothetical protein HDC94_000311 [Leifsonia sp. AK011]|uniref:hypothetical protein n=1 Tax=Leifsonia sp. AK011 TaxID=2723075 RepID=UPI0015C8031C|nr:hypothetical protein [Leifsonia sp. AK011]NYF09155.1 hypothetical protein [Leifsonia sp. AK011]